MSDTKRPVGRPRVDGPVFALRLPQQLRQIAYQQGRGNVARGIREIIAKHAGGQHAR